MRIFTLWEIQSLRKLWENIDILAEKNNAQIWSHPDGSIAVATYAEMEEFCQEQDECDEWREIE